MGHTLKKLLCLNPHNACSRPTFKQFSDDFAFSYQLGVILSFSLLLDGDSLIQLFLHPLQDTDEVCLLW